MVKAYLFDRSGGEPPESAAALLPPWRRERLARLRNGNARRESLCAGLLYAHALRAQGLDPAEPVALLPAGKPVFRDRADAYFSLSHSGRYVLCALSGAPVGADVQEIRRVRPSILKRFHPAERAYVESLPAEEWEEALFRLWTRKEAWVKTVSGEQMLSLAECDVLSPLPGLFFRDETLPGSCYAALCVSEEDIPPLIPVTVRELLTNF